MLASPLRLYSHRGGGALSSSQAPYFFCHACTRRSPSSSLSIKPKPNTLQPSLIATPSSTDRAFHIWRCSQHACLRSDSARAPLPQNEMPKVAFSLSSHRPASCLPRRPVRQPRDRPLFHACRHFLAFTGRSPITTVICSIFIIEVVFRDFKMYR